MVSDQAVTIMLCTPGVDALNEAVDALREWQYDGAPMQLHPGDVGWFWQVGAAATAAALRIWHRGARILAVGLLDGATLLRLTTAPEAVRDEELARQLADDLTDPERGVLPAGRVAIEVRRGALVQDRLLEHGWQEDEPWSPLRRDLSEPVPDPGLRIEAIGPDRVDDRVAVQRAAFDGSKFSAERWQTMAAAPPYQDARCLVGYDDQGTAVAMTTVWSAGPGKPGLIEPLGVHRDHRGHGYGTAITVGGAAALRRLGSTSAMVCTPSANVAAVAAYRAAGFQPLPEIRDLSREA